MRRTLFFLVAALTLILVPLGAAESTYSDAVGDAGPAPDLASVVVSNTEDGTTTFKVTVANYTSLPQFPAALVSIGIFLDLDKNAATGDDGDEAIAYFDANGAVDLERWEGGRMVDVPETNMSSSFASGVLTFTVARSELVNTTGFTFTIVSIYIPGGGGSVAFDGAPDGGSWSYDLALPPPPVVKPVIGKPVATPAAPVAGRRFIVRFPVTRSTDGTPVTAATVACATSVAGKLVPHRHTFGSGTLKATLVVPKAARGKQLKVSIKVTTERQTATKVVTFKIK